MKNSLVKRVKSLSDTQLLNSLHSSVQAECHSTAAVVAHIAEVDARRLYLERAKPSMFSYCVDALGLSEQAAYLRIYAARLTRRFPKALDGLAAGRLHLTALKLVGPYLTQESFDDLLECVSGKSRRAIEGELARLFPREDAPSQLRKLPAKRGNKCAAAVSSCVASSALVSSHERPRPEPSPPASVPAFEPHRSSDVSQCTALSESRYRLQVTLPEHTRAKLDAACDMLRHQVPDGDLALVLDCALDALIEVRMKRKFAKTSRQRREASRAQSNATQATTTEPSNSVPSANDSKQPAAEYASDPHSYRRSRHIPNAIKRAVVERDGMRCSFVDERGERCTATSPLEFHHHVPFAKGGAHSVDNVSLLCRAHNGREAIQDYGRMMERYRRPPSSVRERRAHYRAAS